MVPGKLSVPRHATNWLIVRQRPAAHAVDAGGVLFG